MFDSAVQLSKVWDDLTARVTGPMSFRVVLQPLMAVYFGFRDGKHDAQAGKPPYFWTIFTDASSRRDMIADGWKSIGRVFLLAVVMDLIYQFIVERSIHIIEAALVATLLAIVPYLLIRGPVDRFITRRRRASKSDLGRAA